MIRFVKKIEPLLVIGAILITSPVWGAILVMVMLLAVFYDFCRKLIEYSGIAKVFDKHCDSPLTDPEYVKSVADRGWDEAGII